ncbi:META domain-containing protein, partial [Acinetobacter nosocomialis]|nr:META domain-containing protein [Acinetobacter nosocomialis]
MKIQRLRKKNSIDIAGKLPLKCLFIAISLV